MGLQKPVKNMRLYKLRILEREHLRSQDMNSGSEWKIWKSRMSLLKELERMGGHTLRLLVRTERLVVCATHPKFREVQWKLKTKSFQLWEITSVGRHIYLFFWTAVPRLPPAMSFLKLPKCQEMWCRFSALYSFFGAMLANPVTCFCRLYSKGCCWYFLGLHSWVFPHYLCQLMPFSWEKMFEIWVRP